MRQVTFKDILDFMDSRGVFNLMPDELYLKFMFRLRMHRKLNLETPQCFNDKIQWTKLYDRRPEYTTYVDKYAAKKSVADIIGGQYIIPTIGVWDRFDDIDFEKLPNQFVLKCTHDSGGFVICKDKKTFDIEQAKKKINKCLKRNYYWMGREWPYKNVPHRIIAEQYMADDLRDYKLFCFNGVPRMTLVCSERFTKDGLKDTQDRLFNVNPVRPCSVTPKIRLIHKIEVKEKTDHITDLISYHYAPKFKEIKYTDKPNHSNYTTVVNRTIDNLNENFITETYNYK